MHYKVVERDRPGMSSRSAKRLRGDIGLSHVVISLLTGQNYFYLYKLYI